jgi:hypothetical protein
VTRAVAQILVDLKSADPTALTAEEAIRNLLGFGPRLGALTRRHLYEIELCLSPQPEEAARADLPDLLSVYLERTVVFWNPNKHRAWVRIQGGEAPWEALPGRRRWSGAFGRPDLADPDWDHVLLWSAEGAGAPADMASALGDWEIRRFLGTEIYSLRWTGEGRAASTEERREWTRRVAVARSRREGLLVNPHYQKHRILAGAVPLPLAEESGAV